MTLRRLWLATAALLLASACDSEDDVDASVDAVVSPFPDARIVDARIGDAPLAIDGPMLDATLADARSVDASSGDARSADAGCKVELLGNAGFDQSTGSKPATVVPWTQNGSIVWTTAELMGNLGFGPHQGGYAAYLGGYLSANDILLETVNVPAGTTALRLAGQRRIVSTDPSMEKNSLRFQLIDGAGDLLTNIATYTNVDVTAGWTAFSHPVVLTFAGQTVRLRIVGVTASSLATRFLVDSLSLEATVCQ